MFFCKKYDILGFINVLYTTNNTTDLYHLNLFKIYYKYSNIILSLFQYLLRENKFVYSNQLLPFKMKSINPVQKYPHVIE